MINLDGKVALVTGGASGLGRASAQRLVKNGCYVALLDLPTSAGEEVASEIHKNRCIFIPTDVTSEEAIKLAISAIVTKWGHLDIIVNCAGIMFTGKTYSDRRRTVHTLDKFQHAINIHVTGTFGVCAHAAKEMAKNVPSKDGERGVVINVSSVAAFDGPVGTVAYSSAKGAIASMTLPMSRDLAACGIRVVTIAPGLFLTPIMKQVTKKGLENNTSDVLFPKRPGDSDEFAHLVQTIVENPMFNGEVIRLDGGVRPQPGNKLLGRSSSSSKL